MKTKEAERRLQSLIGKDLQEVRVKLDISNTGPKGGLKKGWAGDVVEKYITGFKDTSPRTDFEDSELKIVPLKVNKSGKLSVKEPMSICMANEEEILRNDFYSSHVYEKMKSLLVAFYVAKNMLTDPVVFVGTTCFKLEGEYLDKIKKDYELLQGFVKKNGLNAVSGSLGKPCVFFSMRPKDQKGKSSGNIFPRRAFTIRNKDVWNNILKISKEEEAVLLQNFLKSKTHFFN